MKFLISNTIRANNFNDSDIQEKLLSLWQQNGSFVAHTKKLKKNVAAVYHDYESDYKGDYSVSICKETKVDSVFDTSKYQWKEYEVDVSDKFGIFNTWKKVWADEEANIIHRVYDFDFESYAPTGEVSIFIAVQ